MREALTTVLTWALLLKPAPALLKWTAAGLGAVFFGLVFFALIQYQTTERRWGMKLLLGLLGGALLFGLGTAAFHWVTGALYGVGYLLTWLAWVLTRRWRWWRQTLARGLIAGLTLGPWLWLGATEAEHLREVMERMKGPLFADFGPTTPEEVLSQMLPWWPLVADGVLKLWLAFGVGWLLVLVGGWGCWRWPVARPSRRRWLVAAWLGLSVLGLNWYAAGRVDVCTACERGQGRRLGYVLWSRPGSHTYRSGQGTLLFRAADCGQAAAIRLLLAAGADADDGRPYADWQTPLHRAVARGHRESVQVLLAADAKATASGPEHHTPLNYAGGHPEVIPLLLAAGADPNAKDSCGKTPLHYFHLPAAVSLLLDAGADPNARCHCGKSPLHEATAYPEKVRLLLAAGANAAAPNSSRETPLHKAAGYGHTQALRLLLDAGADVNAQAHGGFTPLRHAAGGGHAEAIRVLLAAGANVNDRDKDNYKRTSLDVADNDECRELLRQAGGKTYAELNADEREAERQRAAAERVRAVSVPDVILRAREAERQAKSVVPEK
jgi:ankyrin repeat protein